MLLAHDALTTANDLIRRRRTIKPADMDPDKPIPRELMEALFENANHAPTHGLTEPWRFHIYEGDARTTLAEGLQSLYEETTPKTKFREEKHAKLVTDVMQAATVLAICMRRQDSGKIPEIEEVQAVACAVHNIHITASAVGLGAKWSTKAFCYAPEMNDFLGLRPEDKCLGLFYLGWPKEGFEWPTSPRTPAWEKLKWN